MLPSTLESVVIYREAALCRRRLEVPPNHGLTVTVGPLPLSVEPGSLQATVVSGSARVVGVQAGFHADLGEATDVVAEQRAFDQAQEEVATCALRLSRVEAEIDVIANLSPEIPKVKIGEAPREAPLAATLALHEFSAAQERRLAAHKRGARQALQAAQAQLENARHRLYEASSASRLERAQVQRIATLTLSQRVHEPLVLSLEYRVDGVRWAPSYELKIDAQGGGGRLQLKAAIAQNTGEDWQGVRIGLSTAELLGRIELPTLKSLRIGRSQPPAPKSGFRPPPAGLDALFENAEVAIPSTTPGHFEPPPASAPPPPPLPPGAPMAALGAAALPAPMMATAEMDAAPMIRRSAPMRAKARARQEAPKMMAPIAASRGRQQIADDGDEPSQAFDRIDELSNVSVTGLASTLSYESYVMMPASAGPQRGLLLPSGDEDLVVAAGLTIQVHVLAQAVSSAKARAAAVTSLPLPANCHPVTGLSSFDYRYDCQTPVDVASTGRWVVVPVTDCAVKIDAEFLSVPSVESAVYRTVLLSNTGPHALLAGPVDVSVGDAFLITTHLPATPPKGEAVRLGLGVEEAIKVARKTHFKEGTGGLLGGSTLLHHEIEIEVANRLGAEARLEVRERIPQPDSNEKDIKVEEAAATPPWERLEGLVEGSVIAGQRRWRLTLAAGQTVQLKAQYAVRIPSDKMLVGGNRRD